MNELAYALCAYACLHVRIGLYNVCVVCFYFVHVGYLLIYPDICILECIYMLYTVSSSRMK